MQQRGRRSAASLTTPRITDAAPRLTPPSGLTKAERSAFIELVGSVDHRHFTQSDSALIVSYVQASLMAHKLARKPDKEQAWERVVRAQASGQAQAGTEHEKRSQDDRPAPAGSFRKAVGR
jgi:hypothetical protein